MTASAADVQAAINAMAAVVPSGCDNPEAYNLVFKNAYADPAVGWRDGSRKFVIVIGDAPPHGDNSVAFPDCGDQGPDTLGLDTATELAALKAAKRTLMMIDADLAQFMLPCYQELTAGGFTGSQAVVLGTSLASQIVQLVADASATVGSVSMAVATAPAGADSSWISFTPPTAGPVAAPASVPFSVGAAVPTGTVAGTYTFDLEGLADGGDVGHLMLDVVVPPPTSSRDPLTMTKTADNANVQPGAIVTYTITIHNPNGAAATLRKVRDVLPRTFRYVRGSTTGADEPYRYFAHDGGHHRLLTWRGPLMVPAGGDLVITFEVRVHGHRGCFTDSASAVAAAPDTVTGTGPTAQVCVAGHRRHSGDDRHGD
jgi:uncharacterized repeat protein (TIGR01451 family)